MHTQIFSKRAFKALAGLGMVAALGGCASVTSNKFSCPAPDGFQCMNPVEVYEATNDINSVDEEAKKSAGEKKRRKGESPNTIIIQGIAPSPTPAPAAVGPDRCCEPVLAGIQMGRNDSLTLARPSAAIAVNQESAAALNRVEQVERAAVPAGDAYRTAAQIMRIYVAPWEDESGDLHMGGHIFTEIEPRKWRVGHRAESESLNTFSLLKGQVAAQPDEVASGESNQGTTTDGFNNPQL